MRVLITGGSGFIGSNLMEYYINCGANVINLDLAPPRNATHFPYWRKLDINSFADLRKFVIDFKPEYCFHLAARTDLLGRSFSDYSTNVGGVENVTNALKECSDLRLAVFLSSMLVCKIGYIPKSFDDYCPTTLYGESKVVGEDIVKKHGASHFPWVILRPTSIWGPWFSEPYRDFFTTISRSMYFHPGNASVKRSYGFVGNTVFQIQAIQRCNGGSLVGGTSYIGDYDPIDLLSWAQTIQREIGGRRIRKVPISLFVLAAKIGDLSRKIGIRKFPMTTFRLNNMLTEAVFDMSTLYDVTGELPFSSNDGVKFTCDWLRGSEAISKS